MAPRLASFLLLLAALSPVARAQTTAPVRVRIYVASLVWASPEGTEVTGQFAPGDTITVRGSVPLLAPDAGGQIQLYRVVAGLDDPTITGYVLAATVAPLDGGFMPETAFRGEPGGSAGPATPAPAEDVRVYTRGTRGGCYYTTPGGNRVYVDRALCN